jgi:hypothetical protein
MLPRIPEGRVYSSCDLLTRHGHPRSSRTDQDIERLPYPRDAIYTARVSIADSLPFVRAGFPVSTLPFFCSRRQNPYNWPLLGLRFSLTATSKMHNDLFAGHSGKSSALLGTTRIHTAHNLGFSNVAFRTPVQGPVGTLSHVLDSGFMLR